MWRDGRGRCLLGGELVRERHLHLLRNPDDDGLQRAPIIVVWEIAVFDGVLELARPHLEPHEQTPLLVVRLRQHRPWSPRAAVLVHRLDHRGLATASASTMASRRLVPAAPIWALRRALAARVWAPPWRPRLLLHLHAQSCRRVGHCLGRRLPGRLHRLHGCSLCCGQALRTVGARVHHISATP